MSWRPDDWNTTKIYREKVKHLRMKPSEYDIGLIEVGADTILVALFKMAKESPTGTFVFDSKSVNCFEGKR